MTRCTSRQVMGSKCITKISPASKARSHLRPMMARMMHHCWHLRCWIPELILLTMTLPRCRRCACVHTASPKTNVENVSRWARQQCREQSGKTRERSGRVMTLALPAAAICSKHKGVERVDRQGSCSRQALQMCSWTANYASTIVCAASAISAAFAGTAE